jgi:RimJ/RimL family protein N-acetyltransferase
MSQTIPLTQGKVALVDDEDYERVMAAGPWHATQMSNTYYAFHSTYDEHHRRGSLLMHRLLTDAPPGQGVDHINGNGLDNRRTNLRLATKAQNGINRPLPPNGSPSSQYKGVAWFKRDQCWRARIGKNSLHIGYYSSEEEAARAYDEKAKEIYGDFAWLNFPGGQPRIDRVIKGTFVTLRPITVEDAETTQRWRTSGRAYLLNKGAQSVDEQALWIASRPSNEVNFIQQLPDGRPVGMISLVDINLTHKRAEAAHFLIGEPDAVKGQPVALEATLLLYGLAFDTLGLHRVFGPIAEENKSMIRYHLSLGMKEEGRLRQHYFVNEKWQDAVIVGLLEDEYRTIAKPKIESLIRSMSRGPRSHS